MPDHKAFYEVKKAVKNGDLPPVSELKCVDCGKPAKHYDHRDYGKPLEVEPVCVSCNCKRGPAIPGPHTKACSEGLLYARITPSEKEKLMKLAKRYNVPMSDVIRHIVQEFEG